MKEIDKDTVIKYYQDRIEYWEKMKNTIDPSKIIKHYRKAIKELKKKK